MVLGRIDIPEEVAARVADSEPWVAREATLGECIFVIDDCV